MPEPHKSLWLETSRAPEFAPASQDVEVDVAVLGAGVFGLTTAFLLKRAGARVAVVEMDRVGAGVSGYTTAKVTSAHGLIYHQVRSKFGAEGAQVYAAANEGGLAKLAAIVEEEGIDCDLRRRAAYTYTEEQQDVAQIEQEVEAAREAGLTVAFADTTPLPWAVAGAIRFEDQAELHPHRYLAALAERVHGDGCLVFEQTRALAVSDGASCRVETDREAAIEAQQVVVATHFPFLDRAAFFARISPERSYCVAARVDGEPPVGMFLSTESPSHSIRAHPVDGREMLIVGGESHKTGQSDEAERYRKLELWTRERFGVTSVEYSWSTQDNMPSDGIPYIGKLTPVSKAIWTATGFKKWGWTNGTAAAMIVSDGILGRDNAWAQTFDSNRVKPVAAAGKMVKENVNVGARFVGDHVSKLRPRELTDLSPGEGDIVRVDGRRAAAYRDRSGNVHAVSAICTHLGCLVRFNAAEVSWDCPCHGSRFDLEGRVVQGPAVKDLEPVEVEQPSAPE